MMICGTLDARKTTRIGLHIGAIVATALSLTWASGSWGKPPTLDRDPALLSFDRYGYPSVDHLNGQTVTLLPDGRWLKTGGVNASGQVLDGIEISAGSRNPSPILTLSTSSHLQLARSGHTATVLPNGTVFVFGGYGPDGKAVSEAELVDPESGTSVSVPASGLIPRRGHTATLLTDGTLLVAGGTIADGQAVEVAQIWDPATYRVFPLAPPLIVDRRDPSAALLANGKALLWGGLSSAGTVSQSGELYNPDSHLTSPVNWWDEQTLGAISAPFDVAEVIPGPSATDVSVSTRIAVRFTELLDGASASSATVTLVGPSGSVEGQIVPVEFGRLLFFTPRADLWPDSTYTLFLKGLRDRFGRLLPVQVLSFTTKALDSVDDTSSEDRPKGRGSKSGTRPAGGASINDALSGTIGVGAAGNGSAGIGDLAIEAARINEGAPEDWEDWIPGPEHRKGNWRLLGVRGRGSPKVSDEKFASLGASAGVTAVTGRIAKLNGKPLARVPVRIGGIVSQTDSFGRFLLAGVPQGPQQLEIDATDTWTKGRQYGRHLILVNAIKGRTTSLSQTVYLSRINPTNDITIPSPTAREVIVRHPDIPGMEIRIPKGTIIRDPSGKIVTRLSITPVPVDRAPTEIPDGFPLYFTMQPAGAIFENKDPTVSKAARVLYPNYLSAKPGQRVNFWNYDASGKGWYVYGGGAVSSDETQVEPDAGTGEYVVMPFGYSLGNLGLAPSVGPPPGASCESGDAEAGDPVDCATGLFLHRSVDFYIKDVIPIVLTRVYRQNDSVSRAFGPGTSNNYEMFLYNPSGSGTPVELDLVLADGGKVPFLLVAGTGSLGDGVWEHTTSPSPYNGATIRRNTVAFRYELTMRDGSMLLFERHTPNRLIGMVDSNGNTLTIARSQEAGGITRITSPSGKYLDFIHGSSSCQSLVKAADGSTSAIYEPCVTQVQDDQGRTVKYSYVGGRLFGVTDRANVDEYYGYDGVGRLRTVTDRRTNVMVTNDYDADGRVMQQTLADNSVWGFAYTEDPTTQKVTKTVVTDPRGVKKQLYFNDSGYIVQKVLALGTDIEQTYAYLRDTRNLVTSVIDPLNRTTSMSYDAAGRVLSITRLAGTADSVTESFTYDPTHGGLTSYTDPLSHKTTMGYDERGNLISVKDPLGHAVTATVDLQGQVTKVTNALGKAWLISSQQGAIVSITDPLARTTSFFNDPFGRAIGISDPASNTTTYEYDDLDRLNAVTDPLYATTSLEYDGNGNLETFNDARNPSHRYAYDSRNWIKRYTDPRGKVERYQHDGMGNLTQKTDRLAQTTDYGYDALNRLNSISFADQGVIFIDWDAGNRPVRISDSASGTIDLTYDLLDRLESEKTPQGRVDYQYDDAGRRAQMIVAGGTPIIYGFDDANRLETITQGSTVVSIGYDNANRRTSLTLPNSVAVGYQYTDADELKKITYTGPTGTALGAITYTYDSRGLRKKRTSDIDTSGVPTAMSSATYDAANRMTDFAGTIQSYDDNGSLLADGNRTYSWNARNQLATVVGNATSTFRYDAFGRRQQFLSGTEKNYQYDGLNVVRELDGSGLTASYLTGLGLDERFSRTTSNATQSYLGDGLNSTIALTNSSGVVTTSYGYDAYGNTTNSGPSSSNKMQFAGLENDGTGLYYSRARYYSPKQGRFISEDPIGIAGGINTYAYAGGNPVNAIDPLGLKTLVIVGAPTSGNPFGHVALAFSGQGVFSFGTGTGLGSSLTDYLSKQGAYRTSTAYVLETTAQQEAAMAAYLRTLPLTLPNPKEDPLAAYGDTCATRTNSALHRAGITENFASGSMVGPFSANPYTLPPFPIGSQALAADNAVGAIRLPQGQPLPAGLTIYNPQ